MQFILINILSYLEKMSMLGQINPHISDCHIFVTVTYLTLVLLNFFFSIFHLFYAGMANTIFIFKRLKIVLIKNYNPLPLLSCYINPYTAELIYLNF